MRKNQPRMEERIERRISAITSISMCALTVIAQIATTLILTHFLREKASYAYTALELLGAVVAIRFSSGCGVVRIRPKVSACVRCLRSLSERAGGCPARRISPACGGSPPPGVGLQLICRKKAFYSIETRKPSILAMASPFLMI